VIIESRLWPDQNRQINHLPAARSFGEGQPPTRGDVQGPEDPAPTTKLYAESFKGSNHLRRIQEEAQAIIQRVFP
jgi:hypothetical protein